MLPVVALAVIAAATSAVTGAVQAIPTDADQSRKGRISDLERRQALGTLGLSAKQIQDLTAMGMAPVQAMAREDYSRAGDIAATMDQGAGASIVQRDLAKEATRKAALQVGLQVQRENMAQAQRQEVELQNLREIQHASAQKKQAAVANAAQGVSSAIQQGIAQGQVASTEGVGGDTTKLKQALNTVGQGVASQAITPEERATDYVTRLGLPQKTADELSLLPADVVNQVYTMLYQ